MASMNSQQHQNFKYEKASAMRRFQMKRFLETMFHVFNISATIFLFSHSSWFPIIVNAFWKLYQFSMIIIHEPFYAFLLVNTIILFLYALSNRNHDDAVVSRDAAAGYSEIQCLRLTATEVKSYRATTPEKKFYRATTPEEKSYRATTPESYRATMPEAKSDRAESTAEKEPETPPCVLRTVTAVTETMTTRTTTCRTTVSGGNGGGEEKVSEEKKCYRRVQSERRVEVALAARRELKRFNSGLKERQMRDVDINRAAEEFIAKQYKRMWEEQIGS